MGGFESVTARRIREATGATRNRTWIEERNDGARGTFAGTAKTQASSKKSKAAKVVDKNTSSAILDIDTLIKKLSARVITEMDKAETEVARIIGTLPKIPREVNLFSPSYTGIKPPNIAAEERRFYKSLEDSNIRDDITAGKLTATLDYITALIEHEKRLDSLESKNRYYNNARHKHEFVGEIMGACLEALGIVAKTVPDDPSEPDSLEPEQKTLIAILIELYNEMKNKEPKVTKSGLVEGDGRSNFVDGA